MGGVCRIALDIAKHFFQVHGVDKHGKAENGGVTAEGITPMRAKNFPKLLHI
jgi:hypothetical protein